MRSFILCLSFCLILISGLLALTVAAIEPVGRNIIYLHVPAAFCSLACFCVLFICSIQYLRGFRRQASPSGPQGGVPAKRQKWDYIAVASAEVGLVFATVLNVTGSIFARAEWGVWWTPSPRLISSAILWFLYVAYLILRASTAAERHKEQICAVFGIIAFIDIPLIFISARFIRDIHQPGISFQTGWQYAAFGLAIAGTLLLASVLIWLRADMLKIEKKI